MHAWYVHVRHPQYGTHVVGLFAHKRDAKKASNAYVIHNYGVGGGVGSRRDRPDWYINNRMRSVALYQADQATTLSIVVEKSRIHRNWHMGTKR